MNRISKPALNLTTLSANGLRSLRRSWRAASCALALAFGLWGAGPAHAQSETSQALSLLPVASVVIGASAVAGASQAVVALPVALSEGGARLTVKAVKASANGTVYVLERASDGAVASIELSANAVGLASVGVGTIVTTSVIGAGVVLSVAGEVLAFIPNAIGRALLHNERM